MNTQVETTLGAVSVNVIPAEDDNDNSSCDASGKAETIMHKPQRPLSAYNLFFRMLRDQLLNENEAGNGASENITAEQVAQISTKRRYVNEKRCHKKSHGKYGFKEMTNIIITKWKSLDAETRKMFEVRAVAEKEKYVKDMKLWSQSSLGKQAAAKKKSALESCTISRESSTPKTAGKRKNTGEAENFPSVCESSRFTMIAQTPSSDGIDTFACSNNRMPPQSMMMPPQSMMMPQQSMMMPPQSMMMRQQSMMGTSLNKPQRMPFNHSHNGNNGSSFFDCSDDDHFGYGFENTNDGLDEAMYATADAFKTAQSFMNQGGHPMANMNMMNGNMSGMNMADMNMMDMQTMMMMQQGEEDFDMYGDFDYYEDCNFNQMSFDEMMMIRMGMGMSAAPMMMNAAVPSFIGGCAPKMDQQQQHQHWQRMPATGITFSQPQGKRRRLAFPGNSFGM